MEPTSFMLTIWTAIASFMAPMIAGITVASVITTIILGGISKLFWSLFDKYWGKDDENKKNKKNDDKRYILDGINTFAFGNYKIRSH